MTFLTGTNDYGSSQGIEIGASDILIHNFIQAHKE